MFWLALLLLLQAVSLCVGAGFTYDQCDFEEGPSFWGSIQSSWSTCSVENQNEGTPINLCGAEAFSQPPTMEVINYNVTRTMQILNNGHTVQIQFQSSDSKLPQINVTVGNTDLADLVGRSSNVTKQTWTMQQLHLHWGRINMTDEGSEHFLQGEAYAAEAHFVHYNSRFANFSAAVNSGSSDALLVVGVFLEYFNESTEDESATIAAMASEGPSAPSTATNMDQTVMLSDLFNGTGDFYSYAGGLTTPGCNQVVTWVVMSETKTVSWSSLESLWRVPTQAQNSSSEEISVYGNFRPLQLFNGRTVWYSGSSSDACSTPAQSVFSCSGDFELTVSGAWGFIEQKYGQTKFNFEAIDPFMSDSQRLFLAMQISFTEFIVVSGGVFAYILWSESLTISLATVHDAEVTEIEVTSFGEHATKGVFQSYPPNSTGFDLMGIPYNSSYAYLFMYSIDRMDDYGNLWNNETFEFMIADTGITSGLIVMTFNEEHPTGVLATEEGGTLTHLGGGNWSIMLTHTSAIAGYTEKPETSTPEKDRSGLLGLLALLILPFIALGICLWGWLKSSKASKAPLPEGYEQYNQGYPPQMQTYPYGYPSSPLDANYMKPLEMSYGFPASYPPVVYP